MGGGGGDKKQEGSEATLVPPSLQVELLCDYMKVPSSATRVTVMARLRAVAGSGTEAECRAPITLCAAIDRSGSMKDHLPLLKETLLFMVQQLRPKDKLTLITFDDQVTVELPLTGMTAEGKMKARDAIRRVREGGRTNLSGGLLAALQALHRIKAAEASLVESVLLFTDGKANVGIRDQPTMLKATKSMLEQIDRQACVFTFGYGGEHDADLLHALAEAGNGLFYYIDNSESIPESFCDCLGGLLSVAAQNVKLTLTAAEGVTLGRPLTSYKVSEVEKGGQSYQVTIHDMYCEEERCILATAKIPADLARKDPTSITIATCKVEYFDVLGSKPNEGEALVSIVRNHTLQNPIFSDARDEIELHSMRCEVATTLEQAGALATAGDIMAARQALMQVQGKMRTSVVADKPLTMHLHSSVQQSLDGLQDKVTFSKHGKAVLRNYAHSHWQQRSNTQPSQDGYEARVKRRAAGPYPSPPPSCSSSISPSPYRSTAKSSLMAKHSVSSQSST